MPTLVSPQVYVEEIDRTQYADVVEGPAAAIILRNTYKGRENDKVLVTSEQDLINNFGKPTDTTGCYQDILSAIAYLKESSQLYCTRTMPVSATFAGTTATSGTSATFVGFDYSVAPILATVVDPDEYPDHVSVTGTDIMKIICKDRGYCGNLLRVAVCDKTNYDIIRNKTDHLYWETFSGIYNVDSPLETTKEFLVIVQECEQNKDPDTETNWTTVEYWNVSTDTTKTDDLGQLMYIENVINTNSDYIRVSFNNIYNNLPLVLFATSAWQRFTGGRNNNTALNITDALTDGAVPDSVQLLAADLYANAEELLIDLFIDSNKSLTVKAYLADIMNTRKDCMVILDCDSTDVINQAGSEEVNIREWIIAWKATAAEINSSYVSLYGNWLDVYDKYNNRYRWVPASGYVAACFAKAQNNAQYWTAAAGFDYGTIAGVRRLAWNPTLAQRDGIYKHGINPIASFAGQGKIIIGNKTMLDKNSAFNRCTTRRLFISLERDVASIARTFLFRPNNTLTRNSLLAQIKPIFDYAKANDGIDNYSIICDTTNNTSDRIARNELWCDVRVRPLYTSEFIRIIFIAEKAGVSFSET
jgi:hypothetical protein